MAFQRIFGLSIDGVNDIIGLNDAVAILQYLSGYSVEICHCGVCKYNYPSYKVVAVSAGAASQWHVGIPDDWWQNVPGYTMAIRNDGTLWVWGRNQTGQVGNGTTIDRHKPTRIIFN